MVDTAMAARSAHISFGTRDDQRAVRVSHPGKLTPHDIETINKQLINEVIHKLTGCACLSGTIDVIWERNFESVLNVQLGAPQVVGQVGGQIG